MTPHLVYKSLVAVVLTLTRSDAGEICDRVVRAWWQGMGWDIVRADGEAIVRGAGEGVMRATGE